MPKVYYNYALSMTLIISKIPGSFGLSISSSKSTYCPTASTQARPPFFVIDRILQTSILARIYVTYLLPSVSVSGYCDLPEVRQLVNEYNFIIMWLTSGLKTL